MNNGVNFISPFAWRPKYHKYLSTVLLKFNSYPEMLLIRASNSLSSPNSLTTVDQIFHYKVIGDVIPVF